MSERLDGLELKRRHIRTGEIATKVVVVFDDPDNIDQLCKKLGELGHDCIVADPDKLTHGRRILDYSIEKYGSLGRASEQKLMSFLAPDGVPVKQDYSEVWWRLINRSAKIASNEDYIPGVKPYMFKYQKGNPVAVTEIFSSKNKPQKAGAASALGTWIDMDQLFANYQVRHDILRSVQDASFDAIMKDFTNAHIEARLAVAGHSEA